MMEVAELELGADGKVVCNRNKYARQSASAPATVPATPDK
jgi:hypothetical protein